MVQRVKTAWQQFALRLQRQTTGAKKLGSNVAAQDHRTANVQMEFVRPRNVWGVAGVRDMPALERRTHVGGYFVEALRVRKRRRRTDTLLPPMPLSELPMMKALMLAPVAVESKPRARKRPSDRA